jgi:opacity protein-like surface antigen
MNFKSRLLPVLALLASVSAPALAADLGEIIPAPIVEETYTPVEIGSGWYIRGDISYDLQASMGADYRTYSLVSPGPPPTYAYGSDTYDNFDLEATGDFSVGRHAGLLEPVDQRHGHELTSLPADRWRCRLSLGGLYQCRCLGTDG